MFVQVERTIFVDIVLTDNGELPLGYDHKYVYSHFGYNLKATDLQASIGVAQLDKFPDFVEKRKNNFELIKNKLKDFDEMLILPEKAPNSDPSWFGFLITVKDSIDRDKLVQYIESKNIQTRMLFAGNLIKHPCFDRMRASGKGYRVVGELNDTDRTLYETFWVGVYPGMTEQMTSLANLGMLSNFVGMLTDSRSFLSYPRHELYRRVLCSYLGELVERGEYFSGEEDLARVIRNVCHDNAEEYFGLCLY